MVQTASGRRKILVMVEWFWPGYKAGGPISAAMNFVHNMQQAYEVYVFTGDRDLQGTEAYDGIKVNEWLNYEQSKVYYCSLPDISSQKIAELINHINPDFIYLNSLFSKYFTIYPLLLFRFGKIKGKTILAPRGMLKASALQFKPFKKKLFLFLFKQMGFHKRIFFQATDQTEYNDIQTHFGGNVLVSLAADFPNPVPARVETVKKQPGELKIIFVGRIHPIKQLDYLLNALRPVKGTVLLTVTGDEEDKAYAESCRKIVRALPSTVQVNFTGGMPNSELPALLATHHLFALPTKGENFGHAIFEALAQGKPVLISDQTPWRQLTSQKVGWDLPLAQPEMFSKAIQQAVDMEQEEFSHWSNCAWQFAADYIKQSNLIDTYKKLFN